MRRLIHNEQLKGRELAEFEEGQEIIMETGDAYWCP